MKLKLVTLAAALLFAPSVFAQSQQATPVGTTAIAGYGYFGSDFVIAQYEVPGNRTTTLAREPEFGGENLGQYSSSLHCTADGDCYAETLQGNTWLVRAGEKPAKISNVYSVGNRVLIAVPGAVHIDTLGNRVVRYGKFTDGGGTVNLAIETTSATDPRIIWDAGGDTIVKACTTSNALVAVTQPASAINRDPGDIVRVSGSVATKVGSIDYGTLFLLSCGSNRGAVLSAKAGVGADAAQQLVVLPDNGAPVTTVLTEPGTALSLAVAGDNVALSIMAPRSKRRLPGPPSWGTVNLWLVTPDQNFSGSYAASGFEIVGVGNRFYYHSDNREWVSLFE